MDLAQHRDAAVREAFDEPHLPQGLAAIELVAREASDQVAEFGITTGCGHRDPANVELRVEVRLLDPARPVEPERYVDDLPPELRQGRHPLQREIAHPLEREVGRVAGVRNHDR